ncbi:antA/AntB antirepressor family protein [Stenotrophomonas indicatrix]|uniref:antA/AntB antirepressor family protein n=1 Tax=Stenotrophomonas indicatrix TaxID=2045451 RepID=UPI0028A951BE|nr:antA/AntB antirepressor family protein [Stenotrophomonas indicatrix]
MSQIIPIQDARIGGNVVQSVNARALHAFLEVGKDCSNWIKAQVKRARLVEQRDFEVFALLGENPKGGRPQKEYVLSIEAAKHISMMSGTERGHQAREYFIECERRASVPAPAIKDPKIAALVEVLVRQDVIEQEQARQSVEMARLQEDLAVVEARTQPENKHFTVLGYANLVGVSVDIKAASALGRRCASLSRERGLMIGDVTDPRFGKVHTYHESVLEVVMQEAA